MPILGMGIPKMGTGSIKATTQFRISRIEKKFLNLLTEKA